MRGKTGVALRPMYDRRLIAPFLKPAHGPAVRVAQHEATHGAFFDPNRSRPERSTGLGQKRDGDIAFGVFCL
jgi:hypothetical protein